MTVYATLHRSCRRGFGVCQSLFVHCLLGWNPPRGLTNHSQPVPSPHTRHAAPSSPSSQALTDLLTRLKHAQLVCLLVQLTKQGASIAPRRQCLDATLTIDSERCHSSNEYMVCPGDTEGTRIIFQPQKDWPLLQDTNSLQLPGTGCWVYLRRGEKLVTSPQHAA